MEWWTSFVFMIRPEKALIGRLGSFRMTLSRADLKRQLRPILQIRFSFVPQPLFAICSATPVTPLHCVSNVNYGSILVRDHVMSASSTSLILCKAIEPLTTIGRCLVIWLSYEASVYQSFVIKWDGPLLSSTKMFPILAGTRLTLNNIIIIYVCRSCAKIT